MKKSLIWFVVCLFLFFILVKTFPYIIHPSWKTWNLPLSGKVIVVDPGHGGIDGGASSRNGTLEKDITLEISMYLRDYLQEAGAFVIMTRESDKDLAYKGTKRVRDRKVQDLKKRASLVNESDADLFISVHLNAIPSDRWHGAQTFYHLKNEENEKLAKFVQEELRLNLQNTERLAKPIQSVYLVKKAEIPGVLVEAGFLSNPGEEVMLRKKGYQKKVAASIYQGVLRYYTDKTVPDK